jgi:hypothetical protein
MKSYIAGALTTLVFLCGFCLGTICRRKPPAQILYWETNQFQVLTDGKSFKIVEPDGGQISFNGEYETDLIKLSAEEHNATIPRQILTNRVWGPFVPVEKVKVEEKLDSKGILFDTNRIFGTVVDVYITNNLISIRDTTNIFYNKSEKRWEVQ